jgi:hypothetical protein
MPVEITPRAVRHERDAVPARRQAERERVVRTIHASERREVARDQQPVFHGSPGQLMTR